MDARNVTFGEAIKLGFQNYFKFSGRAQRAEFWWFYLFTTVASLALEFVDGIVGSAIGLPVFAEFTPLSSLFSLLTLIPTLALGWRRMHDIGKSGWWSLLPLMPFVIVGVALGIAFSSPENPAWGVLMLAGVLLTLAAVVYTIVLLATDSDRNENRFGPSPKYGSQADVFL